MNFEPNAIVDGVYYRVTRKGYPGHTYLPGSVLELPVEAGAVITKYTAPRALDAALTLADFSELVGPAWPEVTRVAVFEGLLFNQHDGHREGHNNFRPVRTLKHALKLQAKYTEYRTHALARRAAYEAEVAQNVIIGKSYSDKAVSLSDAIAMGFGPGWYIRKSGSDDWSAVTLAPSADFTIIFGYRASRYARTDGNGYAYKLVTDSFHPEHHELIIRPTRPTFGPVVDAEGYQPRGWDTKIPFINAR